MLDGGLLCLCSLENTADPETGEMPRMRLVKEAEAYYSERTVGYGRLYAAQGANEQIDMLVRIWNTPEARAGRYALLENGEQYRIDHVQKVFGDSGFTALDLTLKRLEDCYDVAP